MQYVGEDVRLYTVQYIAEDARNIYYDEPERVKCKLLDCIRVTQYHHPSPSLRLDSGGGPNGPLTILRLNSHTIS